MKYIIYTHNFYTNGKPGISAFQPYMLPVKIRPAIAKLWQVEHEINNKIDIHEVVIVGPISCGDTECLVSLALRQY